MTTRRAATRDEAAFAAELENLEHGPPPPALAAAPPVRAGDVVHAVRPDGTPVVFLPGETLPSWATKPPEPTPEPTPTRRRAPAREALADRAGQPSWAG